MEKKQLLELTHHCVYYIKTDQINFYITIPKNVKNTNISIELKSKMNNYNLELNDETWVMDNIKNTFSYIDNYNITLIIPIFNEEDINILEKIDSSKYDIIDKQMGNIINIAYKILLEDDIKISNQIILVNNDRYKTFITWFNTKYKGRVVCKNLLELIQLFNVNATTYQRLETPVMNFVVGSYNTEVDAPRISEVKNNVPKMSLVNQPKVQPSYGFANYWILVIITLVLAAAVAYIAFRG